MCEYIFFNIHYVWEVVFGGIAPLFDYQYMWLQGRDLNPRRLGYEPNKLPDCSTLRYILKDKRCTFFHATSLKIRHIRSLRRWVWTHRSYLYASHPFVYLKAEWYRQLSPIIQKFTLKIYFACIFFLRIWLLALAKVLYTRFQASNATRLLVFPTSALSLPHDSLLDSAHLLNVLLLCVRLPQHLCSI